MTKIIKKNRVSVKKGKVKKVIEAKVKEDVLPLPMKTVNEEQEDSPQLLKPGAVTTGVYALLEIIKRRENEEKKKTLFKNDPKDIMLQIVPIKIPVTEMQQIRVVLPHPLTVEGSDVCLITQNVKKATKNDHEPTIAYYKSLLQEKKIKGITEIVPIRQLRSEHIPFEMKSRFADMYDMFLVDGRLFGKVTKFLGSRFFKKNKDLIPVKINTDNVKEELETALAKTVLTVHGHGDSYSVKVGFSNFTVEQLEANIFAVSNALDKSFPGGFINIRKLFVKSDHSMAIPIYLSLTPSNSVPVPVVKPRLPKAYVPVEGELTTQIGTRVTVMPTGEVIVDRSMTKEDVEMGFAEEESWMRFEKDEKAKVEKVIEVKDKGVEQKAKAKGKKRNADDESSDDEDVEAAENAYVLQLRNEPKQSGQAKAVGTAQTKKQKAEIKRLAAKSKREVQKPVNNGEDQLSPIDEAPGKVGVKRKQSIVAPKGKKQPVPAEESEMVQAKRKKLNDKSTKVEPTEVDEQISGLEEKAVNLRSQNVKGKASPKAQVGKAKKQLKKDAQVLGSPTTITNLTPSNEEGLDTSLVQVVKAKKHSKKQLKKAAKVGSPNTIINLTPSKDEGLNTSRDRVVKAKKQAILAKKQLKKDAKVLESPNMITKITPIKKRDKKKQAALGNSADVLGATPVMIETNGSTDAIDDMVTDQKKKDKVTKKTPRRESSRLDVMFNMIRQSKIDDTLNKEVNNEVCSPTIETTGGKKMKKRDKLATNDNDTTSELEASTKKKKKNNKLTDATPTPQSLDFGSPPSIAVKKTKKVDKRTKVEDTSLNSILLELQAFGSPAIKTSSAEKKKKKIEKRMANDQNTPTSTEKKKKDKGKRASLGKESSTVAIQGLEVPMTEEKVKKKKKGDKLAMTIDEGSLNSVLRSLDVGIPTITDTKVQGKLDKPLKIKKSKRLQDESVSPALEVLTPKQKKTRQGIKSQEDLSQQVEIAKTLDVPMGKQESVNGITRIQPTRSKRDLTEDLVKEKPEKIKKKKEKSIAPMESEENETTPKTKKEKKSKSNTSEGLATDAGPTTEAASFDDMTVQATVGSQSPSNSEKSSSKTKGKAKDKKTKKYSKKGQAVYVKKSFPRYFSPASQQTLADHDVIRGKKSLEPQHNTPKININEALPHYISVNGKSEIETILANAKHNVDSVATLPLELIKKIKRDKELRDKAKEAREAILKEKRRKQKVIKNALHQAQYNRRQ